VQKAKDDVFDLEEILSTLSRQQIEDFWCSLNRKCSSALLHLDEVEDDVISDTHAHTQHTHKLLKGTVHWTVSLTECVQFTSVYCHFMLAPAGQGGLQNCTLW